MPVVEFAREYQTNLRLVFALRAAAGLRASPLAEFSVSRLLAELLKLSILYPNNDPANYNALYSSLDRARRDALDLARETNEAAEEAREQAQDAQDPVAAVIAFLVSLWPWP